jgi:hypothetical protein
MFLFGLHQSLELEYNAERDVFLSVPLEHGAGVDTAMPSVKTYLH